METAQIMKWLEEAYPDRTATTELSMWEAGMRAGERVLIERLKLKLNIQSETIEEK